MADHEQRRGHIGGRDRCVFWRVKVAVGCLPILRGEGKGLRLSQNPFGKREGTAFAKGFCAAVEGEGHERREGVAGASHGEQPGAVAA